MNKLLPLHVLGACTLISTTHAAFLSPIFRVRDIILRKWWSFHPSH
ncbi:hypothetical protein [Rubritalea tangerina]